MVQYPLIHFLPRDAHVADAVPQSGRLCPRTEVEVSQRDAARNSKNWKITSKALEHSRFCAGLLLVNDQTRGGMDLPPPIRSSAVKGWQAFMPYTIG